MVPVAITTDLSQDGDRLLEELQSNACMLRPWPIPNGTFFLIYSTEEDSSFQNARSRVCFSWQGGGAFLAIICTWKGHVDRREDEGIREVIMSGYSKQVIILKKFGVTDL